ncbi:uncharacterized protein LOC127157433 [Labeo rohita]|uniref:uncharacterized protein LOC127157433 n=1 Tax=Labeo rohita TaxID=84645 RepID=UPI0021E2A934|nr:uncharacterized protein LOC127157433 [Labeo rohita]
MMDILTCMLFLSIVVADGFIVRGPSGPLAAPLGSSVVLPCYVGKPLPMDDLEVEWRRADSETLVHLFLNGESRPEAQQQDYHERAHFFTDQIQQGNFSLRLDNLTAEDEGRYTCKVDSQQGSGEIMVQIKRERLIVSGSDQSVSAYDGEDVTLSCSVDSHVPLEDIEVSWIRTDGDIPVLLFQNNGTLQEASDEQYNNRVEFFTDEITKGNFSLRLKSVRTEDKGVYMCQVFAGGLSANATAVLEQLGFSSWHIAVLFFCFAAGFGAVILLCCLIYCRSNNTVTNNKIWNLQFSLVFCPNICMFLAFILWGFTEGSLHETVPCCALYILKPVMLIWALPYLKYLQDNLKTWIRFFKITGEFAVLAVVVYSVLFNYAWRKRAHDTDSEPRIALGIYFGFFVLICLSLSGVDLIRHPNQERPRGASSCRQTLDFRFICFLCLSAFQLLQLIVSLGLPSLAYLTLPVAHPLLLYCIPFLSFLQTKLNFLRQKWITILWIIMVTLLDFILVIYAHLILFEREKEYLEWTCVILFLEVLKITAFEYCVQEKQRSRVQGQRQQTEISQQGSNALPLFNEIIYMFGAVGLVLLNSVTLTAELILKARNGERVMKDLRVIVFPSECVFALYWLFLQMHALWRIVTAQSTHNQRNLHQRGQIRNTPERNEMGILSPPDTDVSQTQIRGGPLE